MTYYMNKATREIVGMSCERKETGKEIAGWLYCDGTEGTPDLREAKEIIPTENLTQEGKHE